ncbi:uncharacterized protein ACA1_306440 [Acanthamoeba castellanii str. Neff]|uniref:Uncharacterized protein n=1 Tax=Acanthamoeba castellanii (strain ATCC 30010 / Neff) TaxID=1257118 RepID=L8HEC8_ACACF|nr:uncharacterized protein ACA1_306440 [Acanthamoeba castellanii str. Neff]ELR23098.1 hypothetical protein ACA1_306440 [Acanthamoeba castellanii str. Neff]
MVALLNLLANENSPWQLLCLISGSIPNIHSKSAELLLVQDIAKVPKPMAYKKPSLIKRWNLKWVHIAPQVFNHALFSLSMDHNTSATRTGAGAGGTEALTTTLTTTNYLPLGHFPLSNLVLMWIGVNTKLCLSHLSNF